MLYLTVSWRPCQTGGYAAFTRLKSLAAIDGYSVQSDHAIHRWVPSFWLEASHAHYDRPSPSVVSLQIVYSRLDSRQILQTRLRLDHRDGNDPHSSRCILDSCQNRRVLLPTFLLVSFSIQTHRNSLYPSLTASVGDRAKAGAVSRTTWRLPFQMAVTTKVGSRFGQSIDARCEGMPPVWRDLPVRRFEGVQELSWWLGQEKACTTLWSNIYAQDRVRYSKPVTQTHSR